MSSRRPVPVLAIVVLVALCACGAWGALGTFTLASSDPGAARIGVLAGWSLLAPIAAALTLLGTLLWRRGYSPWLLGPAALAVVPWLPIPLPAAVLAWAGPWTAVLWVCAGAGFVGARTIPSASAPHALWRTWRDGRRGAVLAGVFAFVVYAGVGARVSAVLPGGDEPHYLIITQSLLFDGDLRIENNHLRGDYRAYTSGTLKPDYLRRGTDREIYSIHLPGAAALVLPAFALGGYPLVKLWLACLAALAAAVAWHVARTIGGTAAAAWFAWAATALTAPFLFLAFTVYPDGPGALLVISGFAALVALHRSPDRAPWWWGVTGVGPALLPWLHPRFAVVAACLGLACVARAWRAPRRVAAAGAFAVVPAVSAMAWFGYYLSIYGSPNPSVAYGHYTQMSFANAWRGLVGLAFDQQFGLVATAPVYVLVFVGLWPLWRLSRRLAVEWALVVVPYTFVSAMYHMWWGGHSSPARFLGCVMPLCVVPLAAVWQRAGAAATRTVVMTLLGASLALAAVFVWVDAGRLVFNTRDGMALWAVWASRSIDMVRALPSVFRTDVSTAAVSAVAWIGFPGLVWWAVRTAELQGRLSRAASASTMAVGLVLACAVAMTASWRVEGASGLAPAGGQLAALNRLALAPDVPRVSVQSTGVQRGSAVSASAFRVDGDGVAGRPSWAALWLTGIPAGTYRVVFENRIPGSGFDVDVLIGRSDTPVETWRFQNVPRGPIAHELVVRWPVRSVALRVAEVARRTVGRVTLIPVVLATRTREQDLPVATARRYGRFIVSTIGPAAYLEAPGVWTAGGADARLLIEPQGDASALELLVRAGAVATQVRVSLAAWRETLTLHPGEPRTLRIPLPRSTEPVVLHVAASPGFRPSDTEPGSSDARLLGAWLEFR